MPKKPKIDHEYHHGKDKFKITLKRYGLDKKSREDILEKLLADVERRPDRMTPAVKKKSKKASHGK